MRNSLLLAILIFYSAHAQGQNYERSAECATDTIEVDRPDIKYGRVQYKAFQCSQVSEFGIRLELGFNTYVYNQQTQKWLGNHNGGLLGFAVAYKDFTFGVKFKLATVNPRTELNFGGQILPIDAYLNPHKIDYDISYALNLKYNLSVEPYIALTSNMFIVTNEEELGKDYDISSKKGLTTGITLNKYITLNREEFFFGVIFFRYGYGFTNFKKVHNDLGIGYSDISFGIGLKRFYKQVFLKKI